MAVIRVNPDSVRQYSRQASDQFGQMRASLQALTTDVSTVHYFGPNAHAFKTQVGAMALEFSNSLMNDLRNIAAAVDQSTSAISASLGGTAVGIEFDGSPIAPVDVPAATDVVDLDTSALTALGPVVTRHFGTIDESLSAHLSALQATDWVGAAKEGAVEAVSRFTSAAQARSQQAQADINRAIQDQVTASIAADA